MLGDGGTRVCFGVGGLDVWTHKVEEIESRQVGQRHQSQTIKNHDFASLTMEAWGWGVPLCC